MSSGSMVTVNWSTQAKELASNTTNEITRKGEESSNDSCKKVSLGIVPIVIGFFSTFLKSFGIPVPSFLERKVEEELREKVSTHCHPLIEKSTQKTCHVTKKALERSAHKSIDLAATVHRRVRKMC